MDYTLEQMKEHALALKPRAALHEKNGVRNRMVATPIYDSYRKSDGTVVVLERLFNAKTGKWEYAAGSIRVSGNRQKEDGFSAPEQAEKIIAECIKRGWAFRIFSDSGISGGVPHFDLDLIAEMREKNAKWYEDVFRALYLSDPEADAETIAGHTKYMEVQCALRRAGKVGDEGTILRGEEDDDNNEGTILRGEEDDDNVFYRPGLNLIVKLVGEIHTLVITDYSRLSRSALLSAKLLPLFRKTNVTIKGIHQDLEFLQRDDLTAGVLIAIYTFMAQQTRFDILLNLMRGIQQKLSQGMYHGRPAYWIQRATKNVKSEFKPVAGVMRKAVEMYANDPDISCVDVEAWLNAQDTGRKWTDAAVAWILDDEALIGFQNVFGKMWPVHPPLISLETWAKIRAKRAIRAAEHAHRQEDAVTNDWLLSGLLECWCGRSCTGQSPGPKKPKRLSTKKLEHHYYRCDLRVGANGNLVHCHLRTDHFDPFFEELMGNHPTMVYDIMLSASGGDYLMAELREAEEENIRNEAARREERKQVEIGLETELQSDPDYIPDDPQSSALLAIKLALRTRGMDIEEAKEREHVRRLQSQVKEIRHREEIQESLQVAKKWTSLTVKQKNRVLKDVFTTFRYTIDGDSHYLIPVLRGPEGVTLPPIVVERRRYKNRGYIRVLQSVEAWMDSLTAAHFPGLMDAYDDSLDCA